MCASSIVTSSGGCLQCHFRHVTLGGQRVRAGSIVASVDASAETRLISFSLADADANGVQGLDAPVYLLALASNGPLPSFPIGLMDGGPFLSLESLRVLFSGSRHY